MTSTSPSTESGWSHYDIRWRSPPINLDDEARTRIVGRVSIHVHQHVPGHIADLCCRPTLIVAQYDNGGVPTWTIGIEDGPRLNLRFDVLLACLDGHHLDLQREMVRRHL